LAEGRGCCKLEKALFGTIIGCYRYMRSKLYLAFVIICLSFCLPGRSFGYSVLTHEAIIDASWDKAIQPLLKLKYPLSTDKDIEGARAYAYGGVIMPDMGYYPFEKVLLSNLIHYVRTGDFVEALLNEAQNLDEFAFALGVMCHYYSDIYGHGIGINRSEPIIYEKIKQKYGDVVTYEQNTVFHARTEFGFDLLQTVRGNYVSKNYHDFIGFKISQPVMERAFQKTYGLDLNKLFPHLKFSISTFRWSILHLIPLMTRLAWINRKNDILKTTPSAKANTFKYRMKRMKYYTDGDDVDVSPGLGNYIIAFVIRVMPKFGKLRAIKFKVPGPEAEKIFLQSFDTTVAKYTVALEQLAVTSNTDPPNLNYDTGKKTEKGEYHLADNTYDQLLLKLDKENNVPADLKQNISTFYGNSYEGEHKTRLSAKEKKIYKALKKMQSEQK
jgi:hypothetical protein